jgi:hypothetical protein
MKSKFFVVLAALAMVFALSYSSQAQTLTSDIVFLKFGYVPVYSYEYDVSGSDPNTFNGVALMGEYNLNFNNFWIGFGLEWQYLMGSDLQGVSEDSDYTLQFLSPQLSFKFAALGGLYVGAGLTGKYLIASDGPSGFEDPDKKFDLWINGILGYYLPIGEAVFLDFEGKFGYNLTNQQFDQYADVKSNYDIALYIGVGYRASASDY